jgi:hypothetical protein
MQATTSEGDILRSLARDRRGDFLIEEYGLVTESLLRNEESGEKRAAFFVTLASAAGGVFAFAFNGKADESLFGKEYAPAAGAVLAAVLLLLGWMTVRRLIERDVMTDRHILALRDLRALFLSEAEAAAVPRAFVDLYHRSEGRQYSPRSLGKGGWVQTVAVVNAILASAVVAGGLLQWMPDSTIWLAGLAAVPAVWIRQLLTARNKLDEERSKPKKLEG